MEIEKKYLVKSIPDDLEHFEHDEIEQAYLCDEPTLRIRRKGEQYIFTYKGHVSSEDICIADEIERPLTREGYEHLKEKADGYVIEKTRYRIPYLEYAIELDVFHGKYDGFMLAEVEFPSVDAAKKFTPPDWFGEDVSGDIRYSNSYMSKNA